MEFYQILSLCCYRLPKKARVKLFQTIWSCFIIALLRVQQNNVEDKLLTNFASCVESIPFGQRLSDLPQNIFNPFFLQKTAGVGFLFFQQLSLAQFGLGPLVAEPWRAPRLPLVVIFALFTVQALGHLGDEEKPLDDGGVRARNSLSATPYAEGGYANLVKELVQMAAGHLIEFTFIRGSGHKRDHKLIYIVYTSRLGKSMNHWDWAYAS